MSGRLFERRTSDCLYLPVINRIRDLQKKGTLEAVPHSIICCENSNLTDFRITLRVIKLGSVYLSYKRNHEKYENIETVDFYLPSCIKNISVLGNGLADYLRSAFFKDLVESKTSLSSQTS